MRASPPPVARNRSAGVPDLEALLALRQAAVPGLPLEEHERALRGRLARSDEIVLLAETDTGESVGMLEAGFTGDRARLHSLFVSPGHRRRGVARGLLDSAGRQLAATGARILTVEIPMDRERDAHLLRLGFSVSDRLVRLQRRLIPAAPGAEVEHARQTASASVRRPVDETLLQAVAALRDEPVLVIHPPARWRWNVLHLLMAVVALLCLFNTNIFSPDSIRGGLLPILDVVFIIYFGVVLVNWRYRRRTDASRRAGELFDPGPGDV